MGIKNIVFDFGGVLIDWNPRYLYRKVFGNENDLEKFLKEVCHAEWNQHLDAGIAFDEAIAERVKKFPHYEKEISRYQNDWIEMIGGEIKENTSLIPVLGQNYQLYGLTNWSAETFPLVYSRFEFFKELRGIVVSGEEKIVKPDEEIFNLLLERYGLKAEESIFIDDNKDNIKAANKLGFITIHLKEGIDLIHELRKFGISTDRKKKKSISVHRYFVGINF
ncbi:HAD family phosphatase [Marinifilum sp. D714]|uniref:HAD family hydrolase n=1 Tax=Marinifilum sp. D714 TaxID=2937523 RepID=UPI0027C84307|nr:HAD family phosphatase [Marinifilum sp. D714]MDQ2180705.1 HAD family phosphatase [Marinifilum sp. D714]